MLAVFVLSAGMLWAQPRRFKTVNIGPMRAWLTQGGMQLRPTAAVADRVLVRMAPGVQMQTAENAVGRVRGRLRKHVGQGLYVVDLPEGTDVLAAAAQLRQQPGVLDAEPDMIVYPALVPNDPQYPNQWHHPVIHSPEGWDAQTGVGSNVVIAIVDSGCDLDHPDLAGRIWVNPGEIPGNGLDDDANGFVDDVNGWDFTEGNNDPSPSPDGVGGDADASHGTLVGGTAAATGNEGYGVAGVTWGARIMPVQVFPADGGGSVSDVVAAINYAVANGAKIVNLSIGGGWTTSFTAPITAAYDAGVLVVVAGGNSGDELTNSSSTWESPVCNDGQSSSQTPSPSLNHAFGVGATDRNDRLSWYSNYDGSSGSFIDVVGPGDAIYGPLYVDPQGRWGFNQNWGTNSGTSFSCPMAAGLAALLLAQSPGLTPTQLMTAIKNGADNIDALNPGYAGKLGAGRLNVARALGVPVAPAPPTNLTAIDTPGDNGGSVTLAWLKSADDGGGANTVTSYLVYRKTTGDFSLLDTLPAGSTGYVDDSTTDGTNYTYKVGASDGTRVGESALAGPVQSRNDSTPPLAQNVQAVDRPNDAGGAILVGWDPYAAPPDFAEFRVYRSTNSFTSTVGMTPLATIPSASETLYEDTAVVDGTNYYYAVGTRDTAGNEVKTLSSYGPVQSFSNGMVQFAAGLYLFASPVVPADYDPATLFGLAPGSFLYARWLPADNHYVSDSGARPLPEPLRLGLGRGSWVRLTQQVMFSPEGATAPAGDFPIELTPGWHQLGNPFFAELDYGQSTVLYNGNAMDLATADGQGVMAAFAWTYDPGTQNYVLVYPPIGGQTRKIQPWQGFWVTVYKACRLTLMRPLGAQISSAGVTRPAGGQTQAADWSVDWSFALRVSSGAALDSECYVGAAGREILGPKPPAANDAPVLTVTAPGEHRDGNYAVSLAQSGQTNIIWSLKVANLRPGQMVELRTPDLSRLPRGTVAMLEDPATGQSVYLRTVGRYAFTPRSGETERTLRLTVSPRTAQALAIQSLTAQALTSGRGAQVMFTLSSPATCSATVLNIAGRTVRTVEQGKPRTAGNQTVLWDGRNQTGATAPPGMYLLQVTAEAETGEKVRAISPLRLQ
jgi:subtilisin family serine protease